MGVGDALLVAAQVDEDAARWAKAMELAVASRSADQAGAAVHRDLFHNKWCEWTYEWQGVHKPLELPADWRVHIDTFVKNGLSDNELADLVDVAMSAKYAKDVFAYFCGCARNRIHELQAVARALLERGVV